jgi:hypothetical protein
LAPIHNSARLLTTLPGVSDLTVQVMVEIGVDGARLPTAAHRISWTGLCPRSEMQSIRAVAAHRAIPTACLLHFVEMRSTKRSHENSLTRRIGPPTVLRHIYRCQFRRAEGPAIVS